MLPDASTVSTSATSTRGASWACEPAFQRKQANASARRSPRMAPPGLRSEIGSVGQSGGKTRRAQIGSQRVLQQLHDLCRLRLAAIGRAALQKDLCRPARQFQGNAEFPAHAHRDAVILAGQVHGEADVVTAVQYQLALGFVNEAVAGAGANRVERLGEIEPALSGEHQGFTR